MDIIKSLNIEANSNEFRNIKLKLKGLRHSAEVAAVKALIEMSTQHNSIFIKSSQKQTNFKLCSNLIQKQKQQQHLEDEETIIGHSITLTEEQFSEVMKKAGIKNVIGDPICKLCNKLLAGPLEIALHMCPASKHQVFKCDICGEDKWKTKANLHSHVKWCKKRILNTLEQNIVKTKKSKVSNNK